MIEFNSFGLPISLTLKRFSEVLFASGDLEVDVRSLGEFKQASFLYERLLEEFFDDASFKLTYSFLNGVFFSCDVDDEVLAQFCKKIFYMVS